MGWVDDLRQPCRRRLSFLSLLAVATHIPIQQPNPHKKVRRVRSLSISDVKDPTTRGGRRSSRVVRTEEFLPILHPLPSPIQS